MTTKISMPSVEISAAVTKPPTTLHANHKANADVFLRSGVREIKFSGFSIWVSNKDGALNVQVPSRGKGFKFWFSDMETLKEVSDLILQEYAQTLTGGSSVDVTASMSAQEAVTIDDIPF